jgi:hypothetical protein
LIWALKAPIGAENAEKRSEQTRFACAGRQLSAAKKQKGQ